MDSDEEIDYVLGEPRIRPARATVLCVCPLFLKSLALDS